MKGNKVIGVRLPPDVVLILSRRAEADMCSRTIGSYVKAWLIREARRNHHKARNGRKVKP